MDIYKDFILRIRRKEFEGVYLLLSDDFTQKLKEYVKLLQNVKFEDGLYHTFYGDVKRIVTSFMIFFTSTIEETIKLADKYVGGTTRNELICLADKTISIYESNQANFAKDFLPLKTVLEKQMYDEVEKEYKEHMKKLVALKEKAEKLDKPEKVVNFVQENLEIPVKMISGIFNFAHEYLGMMLADSLKQIRISIEEILLRMSNNLRRAQEEYERETSDLLHQLYDKNKEHLTVCRSERKCSLEAAEVNRGIQAIKTKIANVNTVVPMVRLTKEVTYWKKRLKDFNDVADNLIKLKAEQDSMIKQEETYNSLKTTELPGSKFQCWKNMGVNFTSRRQYLTELLINEVKALVTFFYCRGTDRIFYTDNVGPYYLDEFNHQVYVFDYGLAIYHLDCEGNFKDNRETHAYLYDKYGRYITLDGEKIYKIAPCTSEYKLADADLLHKITQDCGHSKRANHMCRMEINDPTQVEILPESKPVDIKNTLNTETMKYLWENFGSLLPEALRDVGLERPKNPIHYLAHKLLYHKYRRTTSELRQLKKEANEFRDNIFKERKQKAMAASKEWKSKQVKRRKPEESDNAQERALFEAHIAEQMFINALNYYYT